MLQNACMNRWKSRIVRFKAFNTHITSVPFSIFPLFDLVIFGHIQSPSDVLCGIPPRSTLVIRMDLGKSFASQLSGLQGQTGEMVCGVRQGQVDCSHSLRHTIKHVVNDVETFFMVRCFFPV